MVEKEISYQKDNKTEFKNETDMDSDVNSINLDLVIENAGNVNEIIFLMLKFYYNYKM